MNATIILLTYNSPARMVARLEELIHWLRYPDARVMVVLNGITDDAYYLELARIGDAAPAGRPELHYCKIAKNCGFAGGMNEGARGQVSEILVFLSDDVRILGDFLTPIREALESTPRAIVTKSIIDYPAGWNQFGKYFVAYPDGSLFAMRREVWAELGGLDEQFGPAGFEDVDLGQRAAMANVKLVAVPTLPVDHSHPGQTAPYTPERFNQCVVLKARFAAKYGLPNEPAIP